MAFFNSEGGTIQNNSNFTDQTDAYANNHKTFISFLHIPSNNKVYFKAFITTFSDSFTSQWSGEDVYGRADPIQIFKSTKRSITLGFDVVASTDNEAWQNLSRIQTLARFLYPSYTDVSQAQTIAQSPLVRVGFMNMITDSAANQMGFEVDPVTTTGRDGTLVPIKYDNAAENGLVCAITSLNYSSFGFEKDNSNTVVGKGSALPRVINVSLSLEPIHRHAIGWEQNGAFATYDDERLTFPYGEMNPQSVHKGHGQGVVRGSTGGKIERDAYIALGTAKAAGEGSPPTPPQNATLRSDLDRRRNAGEAVLAAQRKSDELNKVLTGVEYINNELSDLNQRQLDKQKAAQQQALADARYKSLGGKRRLERDAAGKTKFGGLDSQTARDYAAANNVTLED